MDTAVLDAAEYIFGGKGYQQATMEILAREAGLSVGTLYNLFKSKEEIYGRVAQRIGETVVRRIQPLVYARDPEEALLDVIRLRLFNYVNDRLFFQPFCFPAYLGVQPEPGRLGPEVNQLHQQYVDLVERVFGRCLAKTGKTGTPGMNAAVCLEGMITAFMGYWSKPLQSDNLARVARHMTTVLLNGIAPDMQQPDDTPTAADSRAIYVSRYDLERLRELLDVVRAFGKKECQEHADVLAEELKHARITHPREVPPDVVTMNSRVRVVNLSTGADQVLSLVFPRDVESAPDNLSILNPFGTAILGRRLGDVFAATAGNDKEMYQLTQVLYQPEAAGDYHL
ncbi:MAG TPA: TetR family transcriptional regulator [Candidatus Hydrogenedentes bacterium]|nr:TetR family transcriptional regulator [Candidatus Hydrogenedentota bacterium]HNT88303.1 TetR family transcriptional regulator [Candidatus Hydrogenedentota bacterium]